ncbi:MAG: hypothetical protein ABSE70_07400 [Candidatus Limnocylindrales bacterium]
MEADAAQDRAVVARRRYDDQVAVLARAQGEVDPAAAQTAKEEAHRAFKARLTAATERMQVESAAAAWLAEINRINGQLRAAQARTKREREAAEAQLAEVDRLSIVAETSRAMADAALEACRAARKAMGLPEAGSPAGSSAVETAPVPPASAKRAATGRSKPAATAAPAPAESAAPTQASPSAPLGPSARVPASAVAAPPSPAGDRPATDWLVIDLRSPQPQAIIRLLHRDQATLNMLVDRLAGADATARSCWQLLLSNLVDAVTAAAIDDAFFVFPPGNPFWDLFTPDQAREVAKGLAALGFRYGGMGEFADGRVPVPRDLALAVGAAGLLPARIRFWPQPAETAELFLKVQVATDVFIAQRAPALTLGEIVRLLGRRAELLADLWNDWPRVRPLLFTTGG